MWIKQFSYFGQCIYQKKPLQYVCLLRNCVTFALVFPWATLLLFTTTISSSPSSHHSNYNFREDFVYVIGDPHQFHSAWSVFVASPTVSFLTIPVWHLFITFRPQRIFSRDVSNDILNVLSGVLSVMVFILFPPLYIFTYFSLSIFKRKS